MTENTQKVSRGAGRVAFLAHRDVIKRMLDQGYTRQAIYDDHKAALGFGYTMIFFLYLVIKKSS